MLVASSWLMVDPKLLQLSGLEQVSEYWKCLREPSVLGVLDRNLWKISKLRLFALK